MTSLAVTRQMAGKGAARAAARRKGLGRTSAGRRPGWVTYALLIVILAVSFYPLYYTVLLASSDAATIAQHPIPSLIPKGHFLENIQRVLNSPVNFWKAVTNSVIVSVVVSLSVVFFSTLAGFSFSKLRFKGRRALLVFVVGTMAVPTQLGIVPLFIVMSNLGWAGKLQAVIVPAMVSAFGVFWMTQYLESALPSELIDAARVDGCSLIRCFWHVCLPAARPAAAMLALFTFVGTWSNFFWPFIVLGQHNPTLPVAIQRLQGEYYTDYSLVMAGVCMATVPLVLLFVVAGRQLVAGIMQGAIKG